MQAGSSFGGHLVGSTGHLGGSTAEPGPNDTADAAALLDALNAGGRGGGRAKESNLGPGAASARGLAQSPEPAPPAPPAAAANGAANSPEEDEQQREVSSN